MEAPPVIRPRRPFGARLGLWAPTASLAVALAWLFLFDPATSGFYPQCYFHKWTGLQCPGCGGLRATHQLLHGHVAEAFRLNPLFVGLLPFGAWLAARWAARLFSGRRRPAPFLTPRFAWILLGVAALFGVLRNIPCVQSMVAGWR